VVKCIGGSSTVALSIGGDVSTQVRVKYVPPVSLRMSFLSYPSFLRMARARRKA
jgi:hypothetical protein